MDHYQNSFGAPGSQNTRPPQTYTGMQSSVPTHYNHIPSVGFSHQASSELRLPRGHPRPPLTSGPGHAMFPSPFPPPSYPPPPNVAQQTFPPLSNFSMPPPFPPPANMNHHIPPPVQNTRIPPPNLGPMVQPYHQFTKENVQSHHVPSQQSNERYRGGEVNINPNIIKPNESEENSSKQIGRMQTIAWLQKIGKGKSGQRLSEEKRVPESKINDYLLGLQNMTELISKMSSQIEKLESTSSTAEKSTWMQDCSILDDMKGKFANMEHLLESKKVSQMSDKLSRMRKKRARTMRKKQTAREENLKLQEMRHIKDQRISEWQRQIEDEMKEEKMKKERKINMDRTLAEVTRKINDANRLIDTMTAVEKLRLIRRDAAEKRGDSDLGESRQNVSQKIEDMKRLVTGQLEVYKQEEQVLRDTIKSEYEESNKKEKQIQLDREEAQKRAMDQNFYFMLFGHFGEADISDPLHPYQEFYKLARKNLPSFIQIRQDWDQYINESGSAIPSDWVLPAQPSSAAWATALVPD